MWDNPEWSFSLLWLLGTAGCFLLTLSPAGSRFFAARGIPRKWQPVVILAIALAVRLIPALVLVRGFEYDINAFLRIGFVLFHRQDVYDPALTHGWNVYPPFISYWFAAAYLLAAKLQIPFSLGVKLPFVILDSGIAVLVLILARTISRDEKRAFVLGAAYAFNPVSTLVSAYHGQFDSVALFFMLVSILGLSTLKTSSLSVFLAGLALGLAVVTKSWPVMFLPIALHLVRPTSLKFPFVAGVIIPPVFFFSLYALLFPRPIPEILGAVAQHQGVVGGFGYAAVLRDLGWGLGLPWASAALSEVSRINPLLLLGAIGSASFLAARRPPHMAAFVLVVTLVYATSATGAVQYTSWVVPFALLAGQTGFLRLYTLLDLPYLLYLYFWIYIFPLLPNPPPLLYSLVALPVWGISVAWALYNVRGFLTGSIPKPDSRRAPCPPQYNGG